MSSYLASNIRVPDEGPDNARIMFIGEAPGYNEIEEHRPFIGPAGQMLESALSEVGLARSEVYLTNLCHYRPADNDFENLIQTEGKGKKKVTTLRHELELGLSELHDTIMRVKPKVIVPLGNWPLKFLCDKRGVSIWRGSPLHYINDPSILCVPTFHPSYIQRTRKDWPILINDLHKIARYAGPSGGYQEHQFNILVGDQVNESLVKEYEQRPILFVDIESVKGSTTILCVGFAKDQHNAISIPLTGKFHERDWIARLLSCPAKKVFHFGSFDSTMLRLNGYEITNYSEDTILMSHVLQPELKRSLAFLASIYTDIPYYKQEGKDAIPDDEKAWNPKRSLDDLMVYNGKDVCATAAVYYAMLTELEEDPDLMDLYRYEIELLEPIHHISDTGMLLDPERVEILRSATKAKEAKAQRLLNMVAGGDFNVNSPKDTKFILYDTFKLPARTKRGKRKGESKLTADNDALISLMAICQDKINSSKREKTILEWQVKLQFVKACIVVRECRKLLSSYIDVPNLHGRIHGLYKVGGTETGRLAANKYVDGSGFNPQTVPRGVVEYETST